MFQFEADGLGAQDTNGFDIFHLYTLRKEFFVFNRGLRFSFFGMGGWGGGEVVLSRLQDLKMFYF